MVLFLGLQAPGEQGCGSGSPHVLLELSLLKSLRIIQHDDLFNKATPKVASLVFLRRRVPEKQGQSNPREMQEKARLSLRKVCAVFP